MPLTIVRSPRQDSLGVRKPRVLPTDPEPDSRLLPGSRGRSRVSWVRGHRADDSPSDGASLSKLPRDEMRKNRRTRFRGDPCQDRTGSDPREAQAAGSLGKGVALSLGPHPNPDSQRSAPHATGFTVVRGEGIRCQDALPLSHPVPDKEVRTHLAGAPSPGTAGAHPDGGPGAERPRHPLARLLARTSRTIPGRPAARALLRALCRALPAGRSLPRTPGCALCSAPPRVLRRKTDVQRGEETRPRGFDPIARCRFSFITMEMNTEVISWLWKAFVKRKYKEEEIEG
ncbi:uncharacterized protein [Ovis canadensis]|uniref:uncharacterized protein isoform X4 n=1 Tax=Ovis canadensis TaxID=37174 RepID=UPI003753517E